MIFPFVGRFIRITSKSAGETVPQDRRLRRGGPGNCNHRAELTFLSGQGQELKPFCQSALNDLFNPPAPRTRRIVRTTGPSTSRQGRLPPPAPPPPPARPPAGRG